MKGFSVLCCVLFRVLQVAGHGGNSTNNTFTGGVGDTLLLVHGSLMVSAWGFFVPLGIIWALRRNHTGSWFQMHKLLTSLGLFLTLVGFVLPIIVYNQGISHVFLSSTHGKFGMVVVSLAMVHVVLAIGRPSKNDSREQVCGVSLRRCWEIAHRLTGPLLLCLASYTCFDGVANRISEVGVMQVGGTPHTLFFASVVAGITLSGLVGCAVIFRIAYSSSSSQDDESVESNVTAK